MFVTRASFADYLSSFFQAPHNTVNYAIVSATSSNGLVDAAAYFQIDAATGEISLRQGINLDVNSPNSYTVSWNCD